MDYKKSVLGIEFGSTRIKAVLLDEKLTPCASGEYEWENKLKNNVWTYDMEDAKKGLRECYGSLRKNCIEKFGAAPTTFAAIGISGMMHGYLPFDKEGNQLVPFRTWRNTMTGEAVSELSESFDFNIPQRWSCAHLYQAVLNKEEHVGKLSYINTLAGHMHFLLTGKRVVGVGEASGIFPIDDNAFEYRKDLLEKYDELLGKHGFKEKAIDVLPKILTAGENAGTLTNEGAKLLDESGDLTAGIPFAPPEGDAGTGMVATNSVKPLTGNVSAGTSDFAMVVVDKKLGRHMEIDMVTTPSGDPVAMVHCNNCTSDINAWANVFSEFLDNMGLKYDKNDVFTTMFTKAMEGNPDCGGLLSYNYTSGESITGFDEGRPLFARMPDADFSFNNFMRVNLMSALATLAIGMETLIEKENVKIQKLFGHGGFFKTQNAGASILSAAVNTPVSVMETAGEGGPYGMALLCAYMINKEEKENLSEYLEKKVFAESPVSTVMAETKDVEGYKAFLEVYKKGLSIEREAVKVMGDIKNA